MAQLADSVASGQADDRSAVTRSNAPTVVTVVPSLEPIGGIARSSLEVARGLSERGWIVHCIFGKRGPLNEEWSQFATLHQFRRLQLQLQSLSSMVGLFRDLMSLKLGRVDVVYAHSIPQYEFAWMLSILKRACLALHLRGDPSTVSSRQRRAVRAAAVRIAVSSTTRDHWAKEFRTPHMEVVPNGINLEPLLKVVPRVSDAGEPLRVLYLGRTEPEKGLDLAVNAFCEARSELPEGSSLRIVGGTRSMGHAQWARERVEGLDDVVEMVGSTEDISLALAQADVLLMPSRTEGFGRVAVEAMASGVPVIGTRVGGLERVLAGVPSNRLVDREDVRAIADALVEVSQVRPYSPGDRAGLRERASKYSLDTTVRRIDEILRGILPQ